MSRQYPTVKYTRLATKLYFNLTKKVNKMKSKFKVHTQNAYGKNSEEPIENIKNKESFSNNNLLDQENIPIPVDERRLRFLDKLDIGQHTSREVRSRIKAQVSSVVAAQKADIEYRLMITLDETKKKLFADYLLRTEKLNYDLVKLSTNMELELIKMIHSGNNEIWQQRRSMVEEITNNNDIPECFKEEEKKNVEKRFKFLRDQLEGKVNLMIERHSEALEKTLKLLKEKAISGEDYL